LERTEDTAFNKWQNGRYLGRAKRRWRYQGHLGIYKNRPWGYNPTTFI